MIKNIAKIVFLSLIMVQKLFSAEPDWQESEYRPARSGKGLLSRTFRIHLDNYPEAFNPSIIKCPEGYILTFRHSPEPCGKPWLNYIGAVFLDENFQPKGSGQLLDIRFDNDKIPSQAEDARIFSYLGRYFVTYNDNPEVKDTSPDDRRDIYIAEITYKDGVFFAHPPLKLFHPVMYESNLWEKNWMPFEWEGKLLISYTTNPHEVLEVNLETGECLPVYTSSGAIQWHWGKQLRGGAPPLLVDGEYFGFFHTAEKIASEASISKNKWHYYAGAFTFSNSPPFAVKKISPYPINGQGFYNNPLSLKTVVYPGGVIVLENSIYLAYGVDDSEIWIAEFNRKALMNSLKPVNSNE